MRTLLARLGGRIASRNPDCNGFAHYERQASLEMGVLLAMVLATGVSIALSMWWMHAETASASQLVSDVTSALSSTIDQGGR